MEAARDALRYGAHGIIECIQTTITSLARKFIQIKPERKMAGKEPGY